MKTLKLKINAFTNMFYLMAQYVSLIAPVCLVLAGVAIWFATSEVEKAITSGGQRFATSKTNAHPPKLNRRPLDERGYVEAVALLSRINPAVTIAVLQSHDGISASVGDPASMPEWIFMLSTVQSYRPGLIWSADSLCLKKCESNNAAGAVLKAYTQEIVLE